MIQPPLGLFAAYGIELKYMIVDAASLSVRPIAGVILHQTAENIVSDVDLSDNSWANYVALRAIGL